MTAHARPLDHAQVHLVGSINLASPEDALRACGALGPRLAAAPDGETDYRQAWIHHLAYTVLYPNTDLTVVNRPAARNGFATGGIKR